MKWKIRRVETCGVAAWRLSCVPLGVHGLYWTWEKAIERAEFWSKHLEEIGGGDRERGGVVEA